MVQNSIIQAANSPYSLSEIQKSVSSTALLFHTWSLGNFPLSAHPKGIFFSMLLKYCMRLTQPQDTYMLFTLWYNVFYLWSEESARTKDINILVPKIIDVGVLSETQFLSSCLSHSLLYSFTFSHILVLGLGLRLTELSYRRKFHFLKGHSGITEQKTDSKLISCLGNK